MNFLGLLPNIATLAAVLFLILSLIWGGITRLPCSRSLKVMKAEFQEAKRKLGTYIHKKLEVQSATGLAPIFAHPDIPDPFWTDAVAKLPTIDFVFL